jgi:hypothetical protein
VVNNFSNPILFSQLFFFFLLIGELFGIAQTVPNLLAVSAFGSRLGHGLAIIEGGLLK